MNEPQSRRTRKGKPLWQDRSIDKVNRSIIACMESGKTGMIRTYVNRHNGDTDGKNFAELCRDARRIARGIDRNAGVRYWFTPTGTGSEHIVQLTWETNPAVIDYVIGLKADLPFSVYRCLQTNPELSEDQIFRLWRKIAALPTKSKTLKYGLLDRSDCPEVVLDEMAESSTEQWMLARVLEHPNASDYARVMAALKMDTLTPTK
jgi:hypothetical protein